LAKCSSSNDAGFSLVETLIATGLMVTAVVALAQLFAISTQANAAGKNSTYAAVLGEQKMEQLRALNWGFDLIGLPLSDVTSNTAAFEALGNCAAVNTGAAVGLTPSPAGTLTTNVDGYVDYIDVNGCSLGGGANPPPDTIFIRRWSIEPLPTNPNNTLILQVLVTRQNDRGAVANAGSVVRLPDEARLISVKTRKTS
jgi:hypothetical protein